MGKWGSGAGSFELDYGLRSDALARQSEDVDPNMVSAAPTRLDARTATAGVLLMVVLAVGGATLIGTARYGIGLTPDSVAYLDGAHSFATGHGYTRNGVAIAHYAPGYSAVLSVGERLGIDPADAARLLSVCAFVATTLLGYVLLRRHVRSPHVVLAGTVVIACSAVLLDVFKAALSEHLFIVVVLLLLLAAEEMVARPTSVWLFAASAILVWAGFYVRYAGIVLVPLLALVVLVAAWPRGVRSALLRSAVFLAVALSAPVLWMLRNIHSDNGAVGPRRSAAATPLTNVKQAASTFSGWVSLNGPGKLRLAVLVVGIAFAAMVIALLVRQMPSRSSITHHVAEMWPAALFVGVYVAYLTSAASVANLAVVDSRLLIPVYVPLVVIGAWTFERVTGDRYVGRLRSNGATPRARRARVVPSEHPAVPVPAARARAGGVPDPESASHRWCHLRRDAAALGLVRVPPLAGPGSRFATVR